MIISIQNQIPKKFADLTYYIVKNIRGIRTVQLVKLIYFIELQYLINFGENITEVPIVRIDMGPVPSNYKDKFKILKEKGIIKTKSEYRGIAFYPGKPSRPTFVDIELELMDEVIDYFENIIEGYRYEATEIIKGLSYQTLPMERYTKEEEENGKLKIGGQVLVSPYFTSKDIDPLAEHRKAYRDHLKKAKKFSEEDVAIDHQTLKEFAPLLKEANTLG